MADSRSDNPTTTTTTTTTTNLKQIQNECCAMMKLLSKLEQEELDLRAQNEILTRYALMCGFNASLLEPQRPRKRRRRASTKSESSPGSKKESKGKKGQYEKEKRREEATILPELETIVNIQYMQF